MAVTLNNSQTSAGLYSAFWNRAPDYTGQQHWVGILNAGTMTVLEVATFFYNSDEGKAAYPEWMRPNETLPVDDPANIAQYEQLVTEVYESVFGRAPDAGGLAFYVGQMAGGTSFPQVVLNMITNAVNSAAEGNTDGLQFLNEIQVGQYVAETLRTDDPAVTSVALQGVTYEESSVAIRKAELDVMVNHGATYTLTTTQFSYTGTEYNDTFNAPLATQGTSVVNTLQAFTDIDGGGGVNTLNAVLSQTVTPLALDNIQIVNATNTTSGPLTLNLLNAPDATDVANVGSTAALTLSNIVSGANISTRDVNVASTFSYVADNTVAADLTVSGVTTAGTDINVNYSGGTVNLTSAGTVANSVELLETTTNITTVNVDGSASLTLVAADATTVNANNTADVFTGNLTFTAGVAATVNGGSGNDALTGAADVVGNISGNDGDDAITAGANTGAAAHADSLNGGLGNDVITNADLVANTSTVASNDTIVGGGGVDTLVSTSAAFAAVDNTAPGAVQSISGIEVLTVSDGTGLSDSLTLSKIQAGIQEVNIAGVDAAASYTITYDSAVANAELNLSGAIDTTNVLGVAAAGTATTDALTIANVVTTGTANNFNGGLITATGYETLTLNGGVTLATQTLDNLTVNDSGAETATVNVTGYSFTVNDFDTNNTGVQTINASGLTSVTGTTFTYTDGTFGAGATQSITGSAGNDSITADNGNAATIDGGAGNDELTGGAAADSILGGLGNDNINGAAGNDVLKGNEGDDTITIGTGSDTVDGGDGNDTIVADGNLSAADSINGGAGVNTLSISSPVTSPSVGGRVSNVQVLSTSAASQDLSMFTATTLTTVVDEAASLTLTNAANTLTDISLDATATTLLSMSRAVDTTSNTITLSATGTVDIDDVTLADEETIIIDTTAAAFTVGTTGADLFTAGDLLTLTANGENNVVITNAIVGATALATINNNLTGTAAFTVNASNSTTGITFTASTSTGTTTLTTGSGADDVTAGSGVLVAVTGSGNDTVTGGDGSDTITGGAGADSVSGGDGSDRFLVGTTLTDWAVGDYVAGGTGDTDILSFGAAGVITYADRTVSDVEALVLFAGAANRVTVVEGTGLTGVAGLATASNTLTLNYSINVFAAEAASAADVNSASEWFYDATTDDGLLTYFDEVIAEAVTITLVGTNVGIRDSDAAVVGGNIVVTVV